MAHERFRSQPRSRTSRRIMTTHPRRRRFVDARQARSRRSPEGHSGYQTYFPDASNATSLAPHILQGFEVRDLLCVIVLSWFGMRSIAGIGWLLALGSGIYTITSNSIAMGFHGFLYVISGTVGLLLHSGLSPGGLAQGLIAEYSPSVRRALEASRGDVGTFGDSVGRIASTATRIGLPGG